MLLLFPLQGKELVVGIEGIRREGFAGWDSRPEGP
jgi:hypothetical protein